MAKSKTQTKTVKFEVGQLVEFNNRMGRVSKIAKNGAIYVSVLGEIQGAEQAIEELRVKKADLQLIEEIKEPVAQQEIELAAACADAAQEIEEIEEIVPQRAPVAPAAAFSLESAVALADTTYALRELTFSVTRHSILTAFIDMALNKNIPDYHHLVASNIKNLMAAAFDPVHDAIGYARINTWMMAALELVVKNKDRVAKMLKQPIEAAPIKIDRVTKLGMWLDKNMDSKGTAINDLTAAYDSCYTYDALEKKLRAYTFVVVEVAQAMDSDTVQLQPQWQECLTAQSAIAVRKQYIDYYRPTEPALHLYCGIVPVYPTGLAMQAAIEDALASVIDSLK